MTQQSCTPEQSNARGGPWTPTYTGLIFYPLDPRCDDIQIEDIAHALSNQCRFAGHTAKFYSVAEHSVRVSLELPKDFALWGLLHDASEAYLVDLPSPLKRHSKIGVHYQEIEKRLMQAVCIKFGLPFSEPPEIKAMDIRLLMTEKRDLMNGCRAQIWEDHAEPLPDRISPWYPDLAETLFLERFHTLTEGR